MVPLSSGPSDGLVWHYTDGPGLLAILSTQTLWATASGYLNDAQEVVLGRRLLVERFDAMAGGEHTAFTALRDGLRQAPPRQEESTSWLFILSASRSPDSLAMWRCYGGAGESYAVGLDPAVPLKVLVDDACAANRLVIHGRGWAPVVYEQRGQVDLVDAVFARFEDELDEVRRLRATGSATTRPVPRRAAHHAGGSGGGTAPHQASGLPGGAGDSSLHRRRRRRGPPLRASERCPVPPQQLRDDAFPAADRWR
jgi:hypothetical protein